VWRVKSGVKRLFNSTLHTGAVKPRTHSTLIKGFFMKNNLLQIKKVRIEKIKNMLFTFIVFLFSISIIVPLFLIIFMIIKNGISIIDFDFIFKPKRLLGATTGGIGKDIIGTFILIITTTILTTPLGMMVGIYLSENQKSRLSFLIQWSIDILQGVPSIVIGLIVNIWLVQSKIIGYSAFVGAVALSFMMLPVIIKNTEETIKLIPETYKEASFALGVPYYRTILMVIIPAGLSGITTGILLGISRIAGETAPLLFTAYGNNFFSTNLFKPINSLPQIIYNYSMDSSPNSHITAWGASFILVSIILIINIISKVVVRRWKIKF